MRRKKATQILPHFLFLNNFLFIEVSILHHYFLAKLSKTIKALMKYIQISNDQYYEILIYSIFPHYFLYYYYYYYYY